MPLLQVRDFPDDIYAEISYIAHKQNRTIAQEVITLLKKGLEEETTNRERRRLTFERIKAREVPSEVRKIDSAALIREMREERAAQILKSCGLVLEEGK
jgi:predicted type IV restriction endonuclease